MKRTRKWKEGIWHVDDMCDLEFCLSTYNGVMLNGKFVNSSVIKSMTYRTLEQAITKRTLKHPDLIKEESK